MEANEKLHCIVEFFFSQYKNWLEAKCCSTNEGNKFRCWPIFGISCHGNVHAQVYLPTFNEKIDPFYLRQRNRDRKKERERKKERASSQDENVWPNESWYKNKLIDSLSMWNGIGSRVYRELNQSANTGLRDTYKYALMSSSQVNNMVSKAKTGGLTWTFTWLPNQRLVKYKSISYLTGQWHLFPSYSRNVPYELDMLLFTTMLPDNVKSYVCYSKAFSFIIIDRS